MHTNPSIGWESVFYQVINKTRQNQTKPNKKRQNQAKPNEMWMNEFICLGYYKE